MEFRTNNSQLKRPSQASVLQGYPVLKHSLTNEENIYRILCLDPFVYVSFMYQCRRTELVRHTLNPIWDQTLIMEFDYYGDLNNLRTSGPDVILEIFDKDDIVSRHLSFLKPGY